jgi:hypothetical protein
LPRWDKGKQKACEPSVAASDEWVDTDNINKLIAAVHSTWHNVMDENAVLGRNEIVKLRKAMISREVMVEDW